MNDEGACRTAPATPGLLITSGVKKKFENLNPTSSVNSSKEDCNTYLLSKHGL